MTLGAPLLVGFQIRRARCSVKCGAVASSEPVLVDERSQYIKQLRKMKLTVEEARTILEVGEAANEQDIRAAYRAQALRW